MAENSAIEWTTHTFNPWRGCTKISPGCAHCYAETLSGRNPKTLGVWGPNGTRVVAAEAAWKEPLKWNRLAKEAGERHRVFCASLADVFEDWSGNMVASSGKSLFPGDGRTEHWNDRDDDVPAVTMDDVRNRLFDTILETPNLDWLVLTKRPEHARHWLGGSVVNGEITGLQHHAVWPFDNVWLGTSIENQKAVRDRIPVLLDTPARVHFLSIEPLLEAVDISDYLYRYPTRHKGQPWLHGRIEWVIVGGESGPGARPCDAAWIRSIVEQCRAAKVACFVKQMGAFVTDRNDAGFEAEMEWHAEGPLKGQPTDKRAWPTPVDVEHDLGGTRDGYQGAPVRVHLVSKKGGDMAEWPFDLRVREFPTVKAGAA